MTSDKGSKSRCLLFFDNRITSKCLFLTHKQGKKQGDKKGKDIKSLQDIALTFEERIFFRNNVPDLYNKIKDH